MTTKSHFLSSITCEIIHERINDVSFNSSLFLISYSHIFTIVIEVFKYLKNGAFPKNAEIRQDTEDYYNSEIKNTEMKKRPRSPSPEIIDIVPDYQCKTEPSDEFPSSSNTKLSNDQTQKENFNIVTSEPTLHKEIIPKTEITEQLVENPNNFTLVQPKQLNLAAIRNIGVPAVAEPQEFYINSHESQNNGQSAMQASS